MKQQTVCAVCDSNEVEYLGRDEVYCLKCGKKHDAKTIYIESPYERRQSAVYMSGNRWQIENWKATHKD